MQHPFIDRYVICRCTAAGVHAGVLVSADGQTAHLREARRLWYWRVPPDAPAFLSGVATHGLDPESKLGVEVEIVLGDVCEIIPCSPASEDIIRSLPSHRRDV